MRSKWGMSLAVVSAVLMAAAVPAASAPAYRGAPVRDFHGRDFRSFSGIERQQWMGGHWVHDWHDGRFGWWWAIGPAWYFYTEPVYPYPVYVPPLVEAPPVAPPMANPAPWYYCDNPQGYYPYVGTCNSPWRPVPAAPPSIPPQAG